MDRTLLTPQRLVRTAGALGFRGAAVSPYGRAALTAYTYRKPIGTAAKFLYANRKQFVQLAAMRKRGRYGGTPARAMAVGNSPGTGDAKKDQVTTSLTEQWSSRSLIYYDLTNIAKTTIDIANNLANPTLEINLINRRQRQLINIRGFMINQTFLNNTQLPMVINVAIVAPKNSNSTEVPVDGFFRDYNASRDVNFSTGLSGLQMTELPISTDKYTILYRKKMIIPGLQSDNVAGYNTRSPLNIARLRKYLPFKRQIRYNDDVGTTAEQKVFLVWWGDIYMTANGTGTTAAAYNTQSIAVTYFDEATKPY